MSLKERAIKGTVWTIIQQWANKFVSLITFTLLARLLQPESFGLIALSGTFLAFIQLFLDQGFTTAIVQRKDLEREHLDTAFWTNVGIAIFMTAITLISAEVVADFFREPNLVPVIRWLSLSFLISSLNGVQTAIFQKKLDFKLLAIFSLISTFVSALVGITMAFMGFGVWSLVAQQLVGGSTSSIVLWSASDWRPKFSFSFKHFQDLFSFGINIVGINILSFLVNRGDNLLIGYFLGSIALGYYDLAYRLLLTVTSLFVGVISSTAMPIFSSIQDDLPKLRKVLYEFVELTNTVAFPIFLGMSVLAPELIMVIFGEQWKASIPVIQILSIAGLLYGGFYFNSPLMIAMGKADWKLKLDIYRTFVYCISFLIGVKWGVIGVSIAFVASAYLGSSWVTVLLVQKLLKFEMLLYLSKFFYPSFNSIIMVCSILITKDVLLKAPVTDSISLFIYILVGSITYLLSLYVFSNTLFLNVTRIIKRFSL